MLGICAQIRLDELFSFPAMAFTKRCNQSTIPCYTLPTLDSAILRLYLREKVARAIILAIKSSRARQKRLARILVTQLQGETQEDKRKTFLIPPTYSTPPNPSPPSNRPHSARPPLLPSGPPKPSPANSSATPACPTTALSNPARARLWSRSGSFRAETCWSSRGRGRASAFRGFGGGRWRRRGSCWGCSLLLGEWRL